MFFKIEICNKVGPLNIYFLYDTDSRKVNLKFYTSYGSQKENKLPTEQDCEYHKLRPKVETFKNK